MASSMKLVIAVIFIIIAVLNYMDKARRNNKAIGNSAKSIVPQPANAYQVSEDYKETKSSKAFRESSTYQTSQLVNEQLANREAVIDVLTEFNESLDRKKAAKAKKAKKAQSKPIEGKNETAVEYINQQKEDVQSEVKDTCYVWSIFDDFAASDALYLARKDADRAVKTV